MKGGMKRRKIMGLFLLLTYFKWLQDFNPSNSWVVWPVTEISGLFDKSMLLNFGISQEM